VPELVSLLPLIGIALLFWLFIIRPASRRQRELARMQGSLTVGDQIVMTSGVYGTVRDVADDHVVLEIADGVRIKIARAAVGTIDTKVDQPADNEPGTAIEGSEEN